jgi:hypothetical protein
VVAAGVTSGLNVTLPFGALTVIDGFVPIVTVELLNPMVAPLGGSPPALTNLLAWSIPRTRARLTPQQYGGDARRASRQMTPGQGNRITGSASVGQTNIGFSAFV